jgi:hypothetical protein
MGDGGRGQMTADPVIGVSFLSAVYSGEYSLSFSAIGIDQRTHGRAPSVKILNEFRNCTDTLFAEVK